MTILRPFIHRPTDYNHSSQAYHSNPSASDQARHNCTAAAAGTAPAADSAAGFALILKIQRCQRSRQLYKPSGRCHLCMIWF